MLNYFFIKYRKLPKALRKEAAAIALSGMFDEKYYLEQHPDVRKAGVDPLKHFIEHGWEEGRNPNKDFNISFYLNTYPEVRQCGVNPLLHYINHGKNEGRSQSQVEYEYKIIESSGLFDKEYYLSIYPEVKEAGIDPILHFIHHGLKEHRNPSKEFNTSFYLNTYPEVRQCGVNPLLHYIQYGRTEGRCQNQFEFILSLYKYDRIKDYFIINTSDSIMHLKNILYTDEKSSFSILLRTTHLPTTSHAGGLRILDIYSQIRKRRPSIKIDLLTNLDFKIDSGINLAFNLFNNIYINTGDSFDTNGISYLQKNGNRYDLIDIQFHILPNLLKGYISFAKKIIYTPMESYVRCYCILQNNKHSAIDSQTKLLSNQEIEITRQVDQVVCVSGPDAESITKASKTQNVTWLDTCLSEYEFSDFLYSNYTRSESSIINKVLLYIAYFGSSTNRDALRWFLDYVHHLIRSKIPNYTFQVVGRGDLSEFQHYKDSSIQLIGEVPLLFPYINNASVGIAPALFGSGFRGKINQYAICALPCVASPLAVTGLVYQDGKDVFIADTPQLFADKCIKLLTDLSLNESIGQKARKTCLSNYTWDAKLNEICKIYSLN